MRTRRSFLSLAWCTGLGIVGLGVSGGCGDDSKTTGTQLQMSPEVKAEIDDMRSTQKELRGERRKPGTAARTQGKPGR